jgi:hypothetical protein
MLKKRGDIMGKRKNIDTPISWAIKVEMPDGGVQDYESLSQEEKYRLGMQVRLKLTNAFVRPYGYEAVEVNKADEADTPRIEMLG